MNKIDLEIKRITTNDEILYKKMQSLMINSFPEIERREIKEQRDYTNNKASFFCNAILEKDKFIGLINYWNLEKVYYIEHFAVENNLRGKGYGRLIIKAIKQIMNNKPIILEVEPPIDETSIKRVNFYKKNGFYLSEEHYMQPSYKNDGNEFELKLMYSTNFSDALDFKNIIESIHRNVYNKH